MVARFLAHFDEGSIAFLAGGLYKKKGWDKRMWHVLASGEK
jgi:hypothetical protein